MKQYNPHKYLKESQDDIKIGDSIKFGRFKNKKAIVIGFGTDKNNQPTVNTDKGEMNLYHVRIDNLMESIHFSESLKLSDFKKHSGISDFTEPFMKDRQKLKGTGNKSAKLVSVKINTRKDYVTFVFKSKPTYGTSAQVVDPNTMSFKSGRVYTQQIRLLDFFALASTKPGFKIDDLSFQEVKEILQVADIQVWCSCGSFQFQGINYIDTLMDASIYPEFRAPKRWNKYHNDDSFACKHLDILLTSGMNIFINNMTSMINSYLKKHTDAQNFE